jgi:hypothetical protein
MASREERMAENEAASREFNEEIEELLHGEPPSNRLDIVCECALRTCDRAIDITNAEYRLVRNDPLQFAIVPDHLIGEIERIVYENDRFAVVVKRQGVPAQVAIEEKPPG